MKTVGIDGQIFALQKHGGISRYFSALLNRSLASSDGLSIQPMFARHRNAYLADLGIGSYQPSDEASSLLNDHLHLDTNPQAASQALPSIVHTTFYLGRHPSRTLPGDQKPAFISSLYDMIPENYPDFFPGGNPHHNKLRWLEKSDLIISISQSATADLLDLRPHLAPRIRIIHLGTDMGLKPQSNPGKPMTEWPYFLYVGNRSGYKNSRMVLKAFRRSLPSLDRHRLIFAGGGTANEAEQQLITQLGIAGRVVFCSPNDKQMALLYAHAEAVLVPSLAEGFSLPLIEALATDTPVVCSEISVHKEVGAGFCHFLSPTNVEEWAAALREHTSLSRPSERLGSASESLRRHYDIKRMVKDHHILYRSA